MPDLITGPSGGVVGKDGGQVERLGRWPDPGEPGRFVVRCSCGRWNAAGTVAEISAASRAHDDSPLRHHVVSIWGKVTGGEERDIPEVPGEH